MTRIGFVKMVVILLHLFKHTPKEELVLFMNGWLSKRRILHFIVGDGLVIVDAVIAVKGHWVFFGSQTQTAFIGTRIDIKL